jgi:hypothetical protein
MQRPRPLSTAKRCALLIAPAFFVTPAFAAQMPVTLTTWDLTDAPGNQHATPATGDATHIHGLPLTRGTGLTPTTAVHSFGASGWNDLGPDDWFSFGFTVDPGWRVDLTELRIATRASATGPAHVELRSSLDGFVAGVGAITNSSTTASNVVLDLRALTDVTGTFELRVFAANTLSAGGGIVGSQGSLRITRFTAGTTTSPVELRGVLEAGGLGDPFCSQAVPNSTGRVGEATATGTRVRSRNDVTLWAMELPPHAFGYFLASQNLGLVGFPGGSAGVLCLRSPIGAFQAPGEVRAADAGGRFSLRIDLDRMPMPGGPTPALAGETWNFQAWHRDVGPAGATSNFTSGHSVTFL